MHFVKCLSVLFILTESYLMIVLYMQKFILGTVVGQEVISGNSRSLTGFGKGNCDMCHVSFLYAEGDILDGFWKQNSFASLIWMHVFILFYKWCIKVFIFCVLLEDHSSIIDSIFVLEDSWPKFVLSGDMRKYI